MDEGGEAPRRDLPAFYGPTTIPPPAPQVEAEVAEPVPPEPPPPPRPPSRTPETAASVFFVVVLVGGVAFGLALRAWLLGHFPLFGDEAVVGLMGRAIGAGHVSTFYWGQHYGGVEPYVVAAAFKLFDAGPLSLNGTAAALAAVAAVLTGWLVHESTGNGRLAGLAAVMVWVWPYAAVWNSVREIGFRGVTLACGLVVVLVALKIQRGRSGPANFVVLGLAMGLGWWASPESVYFAVPALVLLVCSWRRLFGELDDPSQWHWVPVLLAAGGAVVGALPWLYTNARTGWVSLRPGSVAPATVSYLGRLSVFFHEVLPMQLGLRSVPGGGWVGGSVLALVCFGLALVVLGAALVRVTSAVTLTGRRAAPQLAAALGVVAFPFVYAVFPTSNAWVDGRYGVYLAPLVVFLLAGALAGPVLHDDEISEYQRDQLSPASRGGHASLKGPRRQTAKLSAAALLGASVVVVAAGISTAVAAHEAAGVPYNPGRAFSGWTDTDGPARQVAATMAARHLTHAYGDYWTAYVLDFLAPGRVDVSPSPLDYDRWPQMSARVAGAKNPAWLFFAPGKEALAAQVFSNPSPGPGGYDEASFEALLSAQHVPYRVVPLGVLDAVVPAQPFTLQAPAG